MRILVIDDEPIIHESIKKILAREGYRVDSVFSSSEGLRILSRETYDAVITDLMMPGMDGLELLKEMAQASLVVPTIMITGYPTIRTALLAMRLGAIDYIAKPFTRKELLPPLRRALRKKCVDKHADASGLSPGTHDYATHNQKEPPPFTPPFPGDTFRLLEHSWAVYQYDGTFRVGIEASFLASIERVVSIRAPLEDDLVEQGFPGITLLTADGEAHGVFLPLSGRVIERNEALLANPSNLDARMWLVRIIPSMLKEELPYLRKNSHP